MIGGNRKGVEVENILLPAAIASKYQVFHSLLPWPLSTVLSKPPLSMKATVSS